MSVFIFALGLAAAGLLMTADPAAGLPMTPDPAARLPMTEAPAARLPMTADPAEADAQRFGLSIYKVTTCGTPGNVHRLSCDSGVIDVRSSLYGRRDRVTCSEGIPPQQLRNTNCAQSGTLDIIKSRCNGKVECELNVDLFRFPDPCFGTYKYLRTTYVCRPYVHRVACEDSYAHLQCGVGEEIQVFAADYGRQDRTTCSYGRPASQLQNADCRSSSTSTVAAQCDGENSCSVQASTSMFGDPCVGTYKYLELAYSCN